MSEPFGGYGAYLIVGALIVGLSGFPLMAYFLWKGPLSMVCKP